jgi:hypothetical protein
MTKIVRRKQGDPISAASVERLKRLAAMPDETINTEDIPERRFNLPATGNHRKEGWNSSQAPQKKAS